MYLIVGLGNPEPEYCFTRHNLGFDVLNKLSEKYNIKITKSNLSEEANNVLQAYAQGTYNASKQLKRLYDYIKTYDEPTIIIFLGDHLPYLLYGEGNNIVDELDYFNTDDEKLNTYRKYNTEALILSNYDADLSDIPEILSPDLMVTKLVNKMDVSLSDYFKWLDSTSDVLPSFNKYIFQDKDANLYSSTDLTDDMKNMYKLRESMQYKMIKD